MKKKRFQVLAAMVLCLSLLFSTAGMALAAPRAGVVAITAQTVPSYTIIVDGVKTDFFHAEGDEVQPVSYRGTTYLPLRAIGELMGKNVNWDQSSLTITIAGQRQTPAVQGTPDDNAKPTSISAQLRQDFTIVVEGTVCTFTDGNGKQVFPMLYQGTTYLPLRAIGQLMGKTVDWDGATETITLTKDENLVTDADTFWPTNPGNNGSTGNYIGEAKAKSIALNHAGLSSSQVNFVMAKLDRDDGRWVYDVEFYTDNREYDYEIDAVSGKILSYDFDAENWNGSNNGANTGDYISQSKAQSIALAKVPGATSANVVEISMDRDDGRVVYEVEIYYNYREYDFEINATTGAIIDMSVDYEDPWD